MYCYQIGWKIDRRWTFILLDLRFVCFCDGGDGTIVQSTPLPSSKLLDVSLFSEREHRRSGDDGAAEL